MNEQEILALETRFWQAMCDGDVESAVALLDEQAAVAGSRGVGHFDRAGYRKMAEEGDAKIVSFEFSDQKVLFPTPDVAIVTYAVDQAFDMNGQRHQMTAYDTTTWIRKDGKWLAAAHSETPKQGGSDKAQG